MQRADIPRRCLFYTVPFQDIAERVKQFGQYGKREAVLKGLQGRLRIGDYCYSMCILQ